MATTRKRMSSVDRRAVILDAAQSVFLEEGYSGARTRVIGERSGVTEAVLYRHFASKEELFEASVVLPLKALFDELLETSEAIMRVDEPVEQRIHKLEQAWIERSLQIAPLLGVTLFSDQSEGRRHYQEIVLPFLDRMQAATAGNQLLPGDQAAAAGEVVVHAAFGMNLFLALDLLAGGQEANLAAIAGQITDLFFLGLSEGRSLGLR